MGYDCRCKRCGTDFVDTQGEFVDWTLNELECPICDSHDIWLYDEIPDYATTFNPIYYDDDIDSLREEYRKRNYEK